MYFYLIFHDEDTSLGMKEQPEPLEYCLCIQFTMALPMFLSQIHWLIAIGSWVEETWGPKNFELFMNKLHALKYFLFKKNNKKSIKYLM